MPGLSPHWKLRRSSVVYVSDGMRTLVTNDIESDIH